MLRCYHRTEPKKRYERKNQGRFVQEAACDIRIHCAPSSSMPARWTDPPASSVMAKIAEDCAVEMGWLIQSNPDRSRNVMKSMHVVVLAAVALMATPVAHAQLAGSTVGVSGTEAREVAAGWSAKRQILGLPAFNDKDDRIGFVDDIVVAPENAVSYAIVNAGGFIGLTKHDVAIPVSQLKIGRQQTRSGRRDQGCPESGSAI